MILFCFFIFRTLNCNIKNHNSVFFRWGSLTYAQQCSRILHSIFQITIEDINDHTPRFDATLYRTKILQTAALNSRIIRVFAYDEDLGENARVTYSLVTITDQFQIDPDNGFISVAGDVSALTVSVSLLILHYN